MQNSSQINSQLYTGWMPFLLPNQHCRRIEGGKSITLHRLSEHLFTWSVPTLPLTANGSWLP